MVQNYKNRKMKKGINKFVALFALAIFILSGNIYSQDEETSENKPVRDPWASTLLIDNQTSEIPYTNGFELIIHHRFGKIKDFKISDERLILKAS